MCKSHMINSRGRTNRDDFGEDRVADGSIILDMADWSG